MAYRLGWVLYWACLALAGAAALMIILTLLFVSAGEFVSASEFVGALVGFGILALVVYGLGRTFRYILSGE